MISESFAWLLWTQTWQVAVVIVFVAMAHRVLARQRPHLAQTLWLLVLDQVPGAADLVESQRHLLLGASGAADERIGRRILFQPSHSDLQFSSV
jgi:hypothetical protein